MTHGPGTGHLTSFPSDLETPEARDSLIGSLRQLQHHAEYLLTLQTGFTAFSTQTTAFSSGTPATVTFSDSKTDPGLLFNISDEKYYAPLRGLYAFSTALDFDNTSSADKEWQVTLVTTNDTILHNFESPSVSAAFTVNIKWPLVLLGEGETAHIQIAKISGGAASVTLSGTDKSTWFSGHLQQIF